MCASNRKELPCRAVVLVGSGHTSKRAGVRVAIQPAVQLCSCVDNDRKLSRAQDDNAASSHVLPLRSSMPNINFLPLLTPSQFRRLSCKRNMSLAGFPLAQQPHPGNNPDVTALPCPLCVRSSPHLHMQVGRLGTLRCG